MEKPPSKVRRGPRSLSYGPGSKNHRMTYLRCSLGWSHSTFQISMLKSSSQWSIILLCRAGWSCWTLCPVQERWCWLWQVACSAEDLQHNTLSTCHPRECQHIGTLCQYLPAGTFSPATFPEMLLSLLPVPSDNTPGSLKGESLWGFWERQGGRAAQHEGIPPKSGQTKIAVLLP